MTKNIEQTRLFLKKDVILMKIKMALAIFTFMLVVNSCSSTEKMKQTSKSSNPKQSKVVAIIGDINVTLDDLNAALEQVPAHYRQQFLTPEKKLEFLQDNLIKIFLLGEEAKKQNLDKNKDFNIKIKLVKEQLLAEALFQKKIISGVSIDDEEAKNYYENNKNKFVNGEEIKAKHILVNSEDEAKNIIAELKQHPENFEKLAKEKSQDPGSKDNGGELGWFGKGRMVPAFEKAAFVLKKDEISDIVQTTFGYHIIKVEDRKEQTQKTFEEAKDEIKNVLLNDKRNSELNKLTEELKKKTKVQIFKEQLGILDFGDEKGTKTEK